MAENPTWGRFLVDDNILEAVYRSMLAVGGPDSDRVVDLMRAVVPEQRFGVKAGVPVKAGWFLPARDGRRDALVTNVVRLDPSASGGWTVRARTGSVPVDDETLATWHRLHATGGPSAVIPLHRLHAPHLVGF